MVTRKEVADRAGVSVATVSNVLSGRVVVSDEATAKVRRAVAELKYVPNNTARSLSLGRSNHIGIAMNESTNPFHMEMAKYIENYSTSKGFLVTIFDMDESVGKKVSFIEGWKLDALINFTTIAFYSEFLDVLCTNNTIMVNFGLDKGMSFGHDEEKAIKDCMAEFARLGHKNVGYISTLDKNSFVADQRGRTFMANREAMGFNLNDDYIELNVSLLSDSSKVGYEGAKRLLTRHPEITALFAMNDISAMGTMRAIKDLGMNCPEDVSVIGCDDIGLAALTIPSLSSIGFDKKGYGEKMAEKIIECVLDRKDGIGYSFNVDSKAIFRESVAENRR